MTLALLSSRLGFPEPVLTLQRTNVHRSMMWLQFQGPALTTEVVSSWFPGSSVYTCSPLSSRGPQLRVA